MKQFFSPVPAPAKASSESNNNNCSNNNNNNNNSNKTTSSDDKAADTVQDIAAFFEDDDDDAFKDLVFWLYIHSLSLIYLSSFLVDLYVIIRLNKFKY